MGGTNHRARPRILAVSHEATRTGAPIVFLRLLEWLKANRDVDIEVLLLKGGPLTPDFAAIGPLHRAHAWGFESIPEKIEKRLARKGLGLAAELSRKGRLKAEVRHLRDFDAVYCNSMTSAIALQILPELPRTVITHVHELDSAVAKWIDPSERATMLEQTTAFVVAADCVGRNLLDNYGVSPSRVHRCYEFVDPPVAQPALVERARERLGLADGELVVGAVGTADWRKGADLFVQLAARVNRAAPDLKVRFVWVGRGLPHDMEARHQDIANAGLRDMVTFVGEVADPASYMSLFDVFCLTSREDPYPLVCLEAGMLGLPVVTFANGGMSELAVADGPDRPLLTSVDYLDVEAMADAVLGHLQDPVGARRDGARLADWVRTHHASAVGAAEIGGVLDGLLTPAPAPASPSRP